MKKKSELIGNVKIPKMKKLFRIMKLTGLLLFISATLVFANGTYSQTKTLNLNMKKATVKEVLSEIEDQSEFYFMYSGKFIDVNREISVNVKDKKIETILDLLFAGTNVTYTIKDKFIVLTTPELIRDGTLIISQQKSTRGKVTDSDGQPLPGVAIVVKGTMQGTVTNADGEYSLSGIPENAILQFSFVGMRTQEVEVANQTTIDVTMVVDAIGIEEVVAIGYGSVKKSDLTGAVSSISTKAILDQPVSSGNSILVGRAAGVSVSRTNGTPGKGSTIRIRGANSLYGGNDPLIVVDGNYGSLPNMYDIESIEILKDASATAIYGSRGANGVIIVKTKYGSEGKPKLSFYSSVSVDKMPKYYDVMGAYEFAEFNNSVGTYNFSDDELAQYKANGGTDWQKEIIETGVSQNYKAVVSGGTKGMKYYVTSSYGKTTGIIRNTEADGYGVSAKMEMNLSKDVILEIKTGAHQNTNKNADMVTGGSKTSIPLMAAVLWAPTEPVYESDGGYNRIGIASGTVLNPLLLTTINNTTFSNGGSGESNLTVKILEGLQLNAKALLNFTNSGIRNFQSEEYNGVNATAKQSATDDKTWLVNAFLTYNKTFANTHNFSLMAGFEETQNRYRSVSAAADDLPLESVGWDNLGLAAPNVSVGSSYNNSAMRSYFGRLNYNYASRYFVTLNYRADGSSKFKGSNQWGYFPSFSLAWKLSEEAFMKNQNIFQNVKIRGGWGVIGNQAISNYATYTTLGSRSWSWGTSTSYAGYYARVGGNSNLKWESTKQSNLGIDLSTLNNRLNISLDYYNKKTYDLLAPVAVTAYNGGDSEYGKSTVISNVGSVRNKGFEFNIDYDLVRTKSFSYDINLNGAFNKNNVISLGESSIIYGATYAAGLTSVSPFVLMPGHPIGSIYGLKYLGIWQEDETDEAAKFGQVPGDYKYQDLNGDYTYGSEDKQVIGHSNPSFTWGFNNHFSYKDFDLNILLEGVEGRDVMNWAYMIANECVDFSQVYNLRSSKDRWTPTNTNAEFAVVGSTNQMQPLSSQYMQDGSYIKLRNVSLSYRIPKNVLSFVNVRVSVSAQNILTITKYKGYDPEINSSEGSDISAGMDWFAYPNPKSFSFGISIDY